MFLKWLFVAYQVLFVEVKVIYKHSEQQFNSIPGKKKGGARYADTRSKYHSAISSATARVERRNVVANVLYFDCKRMLNVTTFGTY